MGRPPSSGGPAFRFTQSEVLEMEARLQEVNNAIPPRSVISALAEKFSASPGRAGKLAVQPKQVNRLLLVFSFFKEVSSQLEKLLGYLKGIQSFWQEIFSFEPALASQDHEAPWDFVRALWEAIIPLVGSIPRSRFTHYALVQVWNWFQNRRYSQRSKTSRTPTKLLPVMHDEAPSLRTPTPSPASASASSGKSSLENTQVEFEAKSARDGAWYDVAAFLSHRMFETSDPEVRVRFSGFGAEEDEWINVRKCVRQRSLPCEAAECVVVLPGDLILCFQEGKEQALYFDAHVLDAQRRRYDEGKEQALYFDAHVLDAQRRRHDVRGCRCRFLVRYDHDQSEEIVPLRKVCRRPETDYRLQILQASRAGTSFEARAALKEPLVDTPNDTNPVTQKSSKQRKMMDVNTDEVRTVAASDQEEQIDKLTASAATQMETCNDSGTDILMADAAPNDEGVGEMQVEIIRG